MPKRCIAGLFALLFVTACQELVPDDLAQTNREMFEELWTYADENYAMFEEKDIDWDSVYTLYNPRVTADLTQEELFAVLSDLINELEDGHNNLFSPFDTSRYDFRRGKARDRNFRWETVLNNYFGGQITDNGQLRYGIINEDIGYIYIPDFLDLNEQEGIDDILRGFLDTRGLILDLRNNIGGGSEPGYAIAARFTEEIVDAGTQFVKTGPGRNDFGEPQRFTLEPEGSVKYTQPIAVLTDRNIFSAANGTVNYLNYLPNVTLVGDTTGGGGGIPRGFVMSNGWHLRMSSSYLLDANGHNVEFGIAPDVFIELDTTVTTQDEILDTALELLP